jgi:hypothetical protein
MARLGAGLNFLVQAADDRIERDYRFVVASGRRVKAAGFRASLVPEQAGSSFGPAFGNDA